MCGHVGQDKKQLQKDRRIADRLQNTQNKFAFETNYRIIPGAKGTVITSENPDQLSNAIFGYYNEPDKKKKRYVFNVRAEGGFMNKINDRDYDGPYLINDNPYAGEIEHQRCAIPASFFIEQPEAKTGEKFLVQRQDNSIFFLGGIYVRTDDFLSFAIITTPASNIMNFVGHHRSPLLVPDNELDKFLNVETSFDQISELFKPFPGEPFETFEVNPQISKRKLDIPLDAAELIQPTSLVYRM